MRATAQAQQTQKKENKGRQCYMPFSTIGPHWPNRLSCPYPIVFLSVFLWLMKSISWRPHTSKAVGFLHRHKAKRHPFGCLFILWRWAVANPRAISDLKRVYMRSRFRCVKEQRFESDKIRRSLSFEEFGFYLKRGSPLSYVYYAPSK